MEFKTRSKGKITIDEISYEVSLLNKGLAEGFQEKIKDAKDEEKLDIFYSLLGEIGLPKEAQDKLPVSCLADLVQALLGQEQKN